MIRAATEADIPELLVLGRAFYEQTSMARVIAWDEASTAHTFRVLIGAVDSALIVAERDGHVVGMAGYVCSRFSFNAGVKVAQEMFWHALPGHPGVGRALLKRMEDDVKARGASVLFMGTICGLRDDAVARVLRANGFTEAERIFVKRV